jgi:hypothetical protein
MLQTKLGREGIPPYACLAFRGALFFKDHGGRT